MFVYRLAFVAGGLNIRKTGNHLTDDTDYAYPAFFILTFMEDRINIHVILLQLTFPMKILRLEFIRRNFNRF